MPTKPKTPAKTTTSNKELEDLLETSRSLGKTNVFPVLNSPSPPPALAPRPEPADETDTGNGSLPGDEEDSSPAVHLDPSVFQTLDDVPEGIFSDEPPPGFMPMEPRVVGMDIQNQPAPRIASVTVPGKDSRPDLRAAPAKVFGKSGYFAPNVDRADQGPDPKYDPNAVNAARRSLQEDAYRAKAAAILAGAAPAPSVPTGAPRRPNADLAVQQALAAHETAIQPLSGLPKDQQYRSRISVSTAYRYDGAVRSAPPFIDRNWAAYDNGPALNIPNVGLLHVGEWLVIQDILDDDGSVAVTEFKIYDDYTFNTMFMPAEAGTQAAA